MRKIKMMTSAAARVAPIPFMEVSKSICFLYSISAKEVCSFSSIGSGISWF